MKIYVASRTENRKKVSEIHEKLKKKGCKITTDWTKHKNIKPYKKNPEKSKEYSEEDINGVRDADVLILLTTKESSKGMYIELGAAIILKLLTGKPEIFIVGDYNTESIFYFHPVVNRVNSIEDVIKKLEKK